MVGGKQAGYLHAWSRIRTQVYSVIQVVVRVELEPATSGLRVRHTDYYATRCLQFPHAEITVA